MAVFNPIVITTAGISLLSQAMAGKGTLTFTSVATSTTVIPYNISNIQAMTALSGIVQTVVPVSAVLKTGNVQVSSIFNNADITNAYTANTIGLYAALGNGAQTLFAVAIATTPDNIPVQNDLSPSNFYYQFNIAISDTSQLTVTVPEDGSLPASVFNQMFPGITAPDQNNDGDALVYNASSGAWGYVNTETVFTTVSGSGEFVSLQKTLADDFKQIQLFGKSVQKPTTGVQLFDINTAKNYDEAEITDYSSGTMKIEQSNSAMTQSPKLKEWCPTMQVGQSYLLTCETTSTKKYITIGSSQWNFGGIFIPTADDLEENVEWHCTTQRSTSGVIVYYRDTFAGIMIVEGSSKKPYEVYTGGEAATEPTPEFPLPITSAGNYDAEEEKYEISVSVTGAQLINLWDINRTESGITVNTLEDGGYKITGRIIGPRAYYIRVSDNIKLQKGTYTLSQKFVGSGNCLFYDAGFNFILNNVETKTNTFDKQVIVEPYILVKTNSDIDCIIYPMINVGDKPLPFEPFKQQLTTLQLPNPFRGIPVDSGGNYTDADGQQWICDYIDRERGKYVQRVKEVVFNGSDDVIWYYQSEFHVFLTMSIDGTGIKDRSCVCDRLISKQGVNPQAVDYLCCGFNPNDAYSNYFYIKAVEEIDFTLDSDFKEWLSNNPIMIIYQLKNSIETDLTPDQLAALSLSTYQGITNIGTDTMPQVGMAVESRGFNLAGDLAQNLIDLQTTVQIQGTTVSNLNSFINRPGRIANGVPIVNESNTCLMYKAIADIVYPVGSIYLSVNNINPGTLFGGTWVAWGSGQVPVGVNTSITQFATVEQTGGEIEHTLILDEIPAHDHLDVATGGGVDAYPVKPYRWDDGGGLLQGPASGIVSSGYQVATTNPIVSNGGGEAHNNLQPYITCYMWKRTA